MRIEYASRDLEKLCTSEKVMRRKRADIASKIKLRISALESAESLGDLVELDPLGRWHRLVGDRAGQWAGKLSPNERLIVRPQVKCESYEDLLACTDVVVMVIEIIDYHG
jgi:proteic killer suppression protein